MRPKVVIFTLVAAFVALGVVALLKGGAGKNAEGGGQAPGAQIQTPAVPPQAGTNPQTGAGSGPAQPVAVSEETRAALIQSELSKIDDLRLQADGSNNAIIIAAIIEKLSNPELEVRKAVLEALKILDDTNAVPGLERAENGAADPREKVAILDTIDFIKAPNINDGVPPELGINTNKYDPANLNTNVHFNPAFLKGNKNIRILRQPQPQGQTQGQAPAPTAPAAQPQ
jgi:hypothetical protein